MREFNFFIVTQNGTRKMGYDVTMYADSVSEAKQKIEGLYNREGWKVVSFKQQFKAYR